MVLLERHVKGVERKFGGEAQIFIQWKPSVSSHARANPNQVSLQPMTELAPGKVMNEGHKHEQWLQCPMLCLHQILSELWK